MRNRQTRQSRRSLLRIETSHTNTLSHTFDFLSLEESHSFYFCYKIIGFIERDFLIFPTKITDYFSNYATVVEFSRLVDAYKIKYAQ